MAWHRIAEKLHMSVRRCRQEMDAPEFVRWWALMELDYESQQDYSEDGKPEEEIECNEEQLRGAISFMRYKLGQEQEQG